METPETFGNLQLLVKLASLGAAGISILAVFIIGNKIFNLPNETSQVKASILKFYMSMCIFMAVVCGASGIANAYFNQEKIVTATNNYDQLSDAYKNEVKMMEVKRSQIDSTLLSLERQLRKVSNVPAEVTSTVNKAEIGVRQLQMVPYETLNKSIKTSQPVIRRSN